jgi:hypothetical protein
VNQPILTTLQDGAQVLRFDRFWKAPALASYVMRYRGELMITGDKLEEAKNVVKSCVRAYDERTSTLIEFAREVGLVDENFLGHPDLNCAVRLTLTHYGTSDNGTPTIGMPKHPQLTDNWVTVFYGTARNLLWCQPPLTMTERVMDIWRYRLFVRPNLQTIQSKDDRPWDELLERGWKLYPMLKAEREKVTIQ